MANRLEGAFMKALRRLSHGDTEQLIAVKRSLFDEIYIRMVELIEANAKPPIEAEKVAESDD